MYIFACVRVIGIILYNIVLIFILLFLLINRHLLLILCLFILLYILCPLYFELCSKISLYACISDE